MEVNQNKRPDYFEGAATAYEDCAKFLDDMASGLPENLRFAEAGLRTISAGFREKIRNLDLLIAQAGGQG